MVTGTGLQMREHRSLGSHSGCSWCGHQPAFRSAPPSTRLQVQYGEKQSGPHDREVGAGWPGGRVSGLTTRRRRSAAPEVMRGSADATDSRSRLLARL